MLPDWVQPSLRLLAPKTGCARPTAIPPPKPNRPRSCLAATDPANAYGAALPWPETPDVASRPQRAAGARVILFQGQLLGYLSRTGQHLLTFLPDDPQEHETAAGIVAGSLQTAAQVEPILLAQIDGQAAPQSPLANTLQQSGFVSTSKGLLCRGG